MLKRIFRKIISCLSIFQRQVFLGMLLGGVIMVLSGLVLWQIKNHPGISKKESKEKMEERNEQVGVVESVGQKIDAEEVWRYRMKEQNEKLQNELNYIKQALVNDISNKAEPESSAEIENLKGEIAHLKMLIGTLGSGALGSAKIDTSGEVGEVRQARQVTNIQKIKLTLSDSNKESKIKHKDGTIPAGSFAKAVLLGGVDASTALSSASDPRPLLIRLMDAGTLPRKFRSDLEDCHIVASGYGDLSSERVFARLEKLTCVERGSGEIVETEVAGYLAGEDGRAGIKGSVIEKGRGYLAKSVLGGVLQGLAGVFNPEQSTVISPVGALVPKRGERQKFNEGMLGGASGSMDRLSKYYIDRAESIQPVIQVASGRIVDVIFTEGADIGSSRVKEQLRIKQETINKGLGHKGGAKDVW